MRVILSGFDHTEDSGLESPVERLLRKERTALLHLALPSLNARQREAVAASCGLHPLGKTMTALASDWGVSSQAVSEQKRRGLRVLRQRLMAEGLDESFFLS